MNVLEVIDLHKSYGNVTAVDGLSLRVAEGCCFGLLGPNGAGKSTTIEILEGIKEPTSGTVMYRGEPRRADYKQKIGIQFQSTALQDYLKVSEALDLFAHLYHKTADHAEIIEVCRLHDILDRDHRKLSGGQRQRVLLALALINDPEIIFLDEPTTGLDPHARQQFWQLIESIKRRNKTIILTTHYMDEAYALCDEIAIVDKGRIIAQGTPRSLLAKHFKGARVSLPASAREWFGDDSPWEWIEINDRIEFLTEDVRQIVGYLVDAQAPLDNLEIRSHTLEDLFIDLTGKAMSGTT